MSCVFFIGVPTIVAVGGWPVLCAAAVAAGATLGYRRMQVASENSETADTAVEIEVPVASGDAVGESLAEDQKLVLERDGVQVEIYKDARGRVGLHVRGKGLSEKQLRKTGEELVGRLRQQFAYQRIMQEMEKRGYKLTGESVDSERRIRIRLERQG